MAKDPWHKGRIGKIKNSPAAKMIKSAGKSAMDKFMPIDDNSCGTSGCNITDEHFHGKTAKSGADYVSIAPKTTVSYVDDEPMHAPSNAHPASRSMNLHRGSTEHMDNVVDLAAYRQKKLPPEGY